MIKRSSSTFYAYLIFICTLVSGAWAVKKTNFVFIYADDLGFARLLWTPLRKDARVG